MAHELSANPAVELAFHDPGTDGGPGRMLRVAGTVDVLEDAELLERVYAERPVLHEIAPAGGPVKVVVFRVRSCTARFWDWSTNLKEREQPRIKVA